mmetsp:Transcript_158201/g.288381  ORF Transcript_158201/g.288381 Transcript_158201/m.288381 type:complete len:678 (-) Transcript_158201:76-2109(-)
MKSCVASLCLLALLAGTQANASSAPVGKVLEMLSELTVKITEEGKASKTLFEEKTTWCEDNVAKTEFAIKTGKTEVAELSATLQKTDSQITAFEAEIEKKSADIATDEADLAAATKVRETEASTFAAEEKELTETIGTLERAISILSREMSGGASMLQLKNAQSVVQALDVMVQASAFSTADASRLTALVQSSQQSGDSSDDEELGAPAGEVYTSHSGSIVSTLQDLLEKAEGQLDSARKTEMSNTQNYEMLKQSLTDEVKFATKDLDAAKTGLAASKEAKASAEGDLSTTSKSLAEDETDLEDMKEDCLTATETYEAEVKSRDAELAAIAKASEVIQEAMPGSALNQVSFMQLSRMRITSGKDLVNFEVVHFVRDLGRKHNSAALAQLSSKIASIIRLGSADPFAKVKGLIEDMIAKLEDAAAADATKNDWCIKETATTTAKKEELEAEVEKLTTKINKKSAKAASLKEEVADLQKELAGIAKAEADADAMRIAEKAKFDKDSEETKTAIEGVKTALQVLQEYYASDKAHEAGEGAGSSIISLLEVCESDFSKALAEMTVAETTAAAEYEKMKEENKLTVATKEQDVKYKAKEAAALAKSTAEDQGDLETVESELSAVVESLASITQQCTSKVETYAEKKAARDAEIAGLKEALTILEQQTVLLETNSRRMLRGRR